MSFVSVVVVRYVVYLFFVSVYSVVVTVEDVSSVWEFGSSTC